jgi:hypothetical protein
MKSYTYIVPYTFLSFTFYFNKIALVLIFNQQVLPSNIGVEILLPAQLPAVLY